MEAVIRPERLDGVVEKLSELTCPGATTSDVRGHGRQMGVTHIWRGSTYTVRRLPKVKVEVVVLDEDAGRVTAAIVNAAGTESIGDGKVFVHDVVDAVRVRTGESGTKAI